MFDLKKIKENCHTKNFIFAGCDEVGRGPLAGPVISSCVAFKINSFDEKEVGRILKYFKKLGIDDSKKISPVLREVIIHSFSGLMDKIIQFVEIGKVEKFEFILSKNVKMIVSIDAISPEIIDEMNILNASLLSMKNSAKQICNFERGLILIDGNKEFKNDFSSFKVESLVKGDSKSLIIGLASIIAKTTRDKVMKMHSLQYPEYGWEKNSGYPTKFHLQAIKAYGVTKLHRKTFRGVSEFC